MADASAVQFLVHNMAQLAKYRFDLIAKSEEGVEQLAMDMEYFNSFLQLASHFEYQRQQEFVRQIREVMYDAEDVLDAFVTQMDSVKSSSRITRIFKKGVKLDRIVERVRRVRRNLEIVYGDRWNLDMESINRGNADEEKFELETQVRRVREENVVGLEKDTDTIVGYLLQETPRLDVISIVGMPGLGKSTLAWKAFRDPRIQNEFPTRLWVYVSNSTKRDVFLSILRDFRSVTEDLRAMKEDTLARMVNDYMEKGKFLLVMDDVRAPKDWSVISAALPATNYCGKILITSRRNDVGLLANPIRQPYYLGLLDAENSMELLQRHVFGEPKWEPDFEYHGRQIAEECRGLPLAIEVIGGIIAKKLSLIVDRTAKLNAWRKFSERVAEYLLDDSERMEKVISLSYDRLPHNLRPCFLYFGMFPGEIEIPTSKLFSMWVAEGFVQEKVGFSLEEAAESYLEELIIRNLVTVASRNPYGKVKTCRIHDLLLDFCKNRARKENENFLEEITKSREGILTPAVIDDAYYRRLCIHSNVSQFLASKPSGHRVRSLVCFSKEDLTLGSDQVSAIPKGFKLLRVLDMKPAKFSRLPADMYELLHLRYIHLSFNSNVLPRDFSKLWNLQTLIVDTSQRTLEIKADIWKMRHLRHVKTNATATLPEPTKATAQGKSNIQTLGTISPESCTAEALESAQNLRRLNIRGKLEMLLISKRTGASFDHMVRLMKLQKLKLENDAFPLPPSEGQLTRLPPAQKFPPYLRILALSNTYLDWSEMKVLGFLKNLEVLKLKESAFVGDIWETAADGFLRLITLFIGRTNLVNWKVSSSGIFPSLVHLKLHDCVNLCEIPVEFAENPNLSILILNHCQKAAPSAEEIRRKKMEADATVEFKLSIFPPIDNQWSTS